MQNSNQASVQNSNFDCNIAGFRCKSGVGFHWFTDLHNLSNNGHFTLATLPSCNLTRILKLETYVFELKMDIKMNLNWTHLSNSHAGLAPETNNNNPIKIRVLN